MIPNINVKTNKINFIYEVAPAAPVVVPITVEVGFYTPAQLAAEIQTIVRAIDPPNTGTFFMTYGPSTGTIGSNLPIFEYGSGSGAVGVAFSPMTPNTAAYPYDDNARQLFDVLGFSIVNSTPDGNAFGGPTFAQATRYVDIVCNQLTNNQALKDTGSQKVMRDAICRIYIVDPANIQSTVAPSSATFCPPGCAATTIYRNFSQPKQIQWLPNQPIVGSLQFQVYDDEGDLLTITESYASTVPPSRANWSMTMLVSEN
jgi:hypothetical protein